MSAEFSVANDLNDRSPCHTISAVSGHSDMKKGAPTIFGPLAVLREDLQPAQEELSAFLEQMKKQGALMPLVKGLARLRLLLIHIDAFEQRRRLDPGQLDLRERMAFGILLHTRLINDELLQAVTRFHYHLRALATLDLESPAAFIAAAKRTMKRLNRKKIAHALRMVRLTEMIEERKEMIKGLEARRSALTAELLRIAGYVQGNLAAMEMVCRKAIVMLVEIGLAKQKESELIEDIRNRFKKGLKRSLSVRQLTIEDQAKAKLAVDRLTNKLSSLIRDDLHQLSRMYEAVHERAQVVANELGILLAGAEDVKGDREREGMELFRRIEVVLAALVADIPRELKPYRSAVDTTVNALVLEKRHEMVDHLLEQVGIERRKRSDRRTAQYRRRRPDPNYRGPERRALRDRRTRAGRRTF